MIDFFFKKWNGKEIFVNVACKRKCLGVVRLISHRHPFGYLRFFFSMVLMGDNILLQFDVLFMFFFDFFLYFWAQIELLFSFFFVGLGFFCIVLPFLHFVYSHYSFVLFLSLRCHDVWLTVPRFPCVLFAFFFSCCCCM